MMLTERQNHERTILLVAAALCKKAEYESLLSYLPFCGDDVIEAIHEQYSDMLEESNLKHGGA